MTDETGASMLVEKSGQNTVKVTVGPTDGITQYNGVGVDFDLASAMLGREDSLKSATLKTAAFDLSTAEGKAAYNNFLATGEMPGNNGNGISDVKTLSKNDYSSQPNFQAKVGDASLEIKGSSNTGNTLVTKYPDGTSDYQFDARDGRNVPLTIQRKYDAQGHAVPGSTTYSYELHLDDTDPIWLETVQTGQAASDTGRYSSGQTVTVTYTEAEMTQLRDDAVRISGSGETMHMDRFAEIATSNGNPLSTDDFAFSMARSMDMDTRGFVTALTTISDAADGHTDGHYVALPGTVTVKS